MLGYIFDSQPSCMTCWFVYIVKAENNIWDAGVTK
jgi:predicted GIY-YIG superfamily endonuclease